MPILPGKLAVRGLPGAQRRDATAGSALMGAFAATRCPAREDGQAALAGAVTACQGFDLGRCGIVGEIETCVPQLRPGW